MVQHCGAKPSPARPTSVFELSKFVSVINIKYHLFIVANFPQEWSACTVTCGGGTRSRFGRCCSSECTRVTFDTEACNSSPC